MPYQVDAKSVDRLIREALTHEFIVKGANGDQRRLKRLEEALTAKAAEIELLSKEAIQATIAEHAEAEGRLEKATEQSSQVASRRPYLARDLKSFFTFLHIAIFAAVVLFFIARYFDDESRTVLTMAVWLFGTALSLRVLFAFLGDRAKTRHDNLVKQKHAELGIDGLSQAVEALRRRADREIIENVILPEATTALNCIFGRSHELVMNELPDGGGLAEGLYTSQEIDTQAKSRLQGCLRLMPGGSLGLAGPRGVGKTTLINYCYSLPQLKDKEVLAVRTTAPVEYETRDFLLHMFATLCDAVMKKSKRHEEFGHWPDFQEEPTAAHNLFVPFLLSRWLGVGLIAMGVVLFTLAIGMTVVLATEPDTGNGPGGAQANSSPQSGSHSVTPNSSNNSEADQDQGNALTVASFLRALDLKPGTVLGVGFAFFFFGWAQVYLRRLAWQYRVLIPMRDPWRQTQERVLEGEAVRWRQEIRFQRTYSSGWSGSLSIPFGLEGSTNRAVEFAQKQLSLPEITSGFRHVLTLAVTKYAVVVGVDELDKLESADKAHRFLNEIKAIFGLADCFFLISVSESAMSSFERRGLPFRDAFDSAFDDIIYVDYLSVVHSIDLIMRRVIRLPVPFVCLCHCLSGGLARDLIRTCRHLLEAAQAIRGQVGAGLPNQMVHLSSVCAALIKDELQKKMRAISVSIKDLDAEATVQPFLSRLAEIQGQAQSPLGLLDVCDLFASGTQAPAQAARPIALLLAEGHSAAMERAVPGESEQTLAALREELIAYLYYLATVWEFFAAVSDVALKDHLPETRLDLLAKARQSFALSPSLAQAQVTEFRTLHKLKIPAFASTSQ